MNPRKLSVALVLSLLLVALVAPLPAAADYQVVGTATSRSPGHLVRTEYTVQVDSNPLDQFKMVRLVKSGPAQRLRGSILFLPPLGTTFSFYEQRDPKGAAGSSIAEFFALRNFDVYGYSPRFEGIPAGTCEAGVLDCSAMAGWGLQSMVDDIAFVRAQIEELHPGTRIVAGGASLGGMLAIAAANADPTSYDGIFPWEGMLYSADPDVRSINDGSCAGLQAQIGAGVIYDAVGGGVLRQVAQYAELAPGGLSPIRLFPPGLTNHQVLVLALSVPTPGPVTMPVPGYVLMAGSLPDDKLFFASEARVYDNIRRFNAYIPNVLVRDIVCSLAGNDSTHVANLGAFTGSVLMIGGGHGFGAYMGDQLAQFGGSDKTLLLEPDFGHIDHFMTRRHRDVVERPILAWVQRLFR